MTDTKRIWEQQEGEPNEAYARFLVYRNLGVSRSLDAAHAIATKSKKKQASGQWTDDSAKWNWVERASAWDIDVLAEVGRGVVVKFVSALNLSFDAMISQLASGKIKPRTWSQVLESITVLGNFIPQETVAEIRRLASDADNVPAIGHGDNADRTEP